MKASKSKCIRSIELYSDVMLDGCVIWKGPTKGASIPHLPEFPARSIARIYYRSRMGKNVPSHLRIQGRTCGNPLCIAPTHLKFIVRPLEVVSESEFKWTF